MTARPAWADPAPLARSQDAEDRHAEAGGRQEHAHQVELTPGSGGVSLIFRVSSRITATMTTSPANTSRQVHSVVTAPPISGPAATAIAPAEATSP